MGLRRDAGEREDEDVVEYLKDDLREGEFYADCKAGAAKYFKDNKLDPRVHWEMYAKTLVILTGVVVGHYGSLFDSYHPERARATLEKYRIGALRRDAGERAAIYSYLYLT